MNKYKHQLFYSNTLSAEKRQKWNIIRDTILRILKGALVSIF